MLVCLHKQGELLLYLFSSTHSEWNTPPFPREMSWMKSQSLSGSVTHSFSLSRGQEEGQGMGKPGDRTSSVLQLSAPQNGRLQQPEAGNGQDVGPFSRQTVGAQRWRRRGYFVGTHSPLCATGRLLPGKYWRHPLGINL